MADNQPIKPSSKIVHAPQPALAPKTPNKAKNADQNPAPEKPKLSGGMFKKPEELTSEIDLLPAGTNIGVPDPVELSGDFGRSGSGIILEPLEKETPVPVLEKKPLQPPKRTAPVSSAPKHPTLPPVRDDLPLDILFDIGALELLTTGEQVAVQPDAPSAPKIQFAQSPEEQAKKLEAMARLQFGNSSDNGNLHITASFKPGIQGKTASVFKLMLPADGFKMADLERKLGLPAKTVGECFPKQTDIENKKAVREMWEIPDSLTFNNIRPLEKILALKKEEAEELNAAASDPKQRNEILKGLVKSRIIKYPNGPRFLCGLKPNQLQSTEDGKPIMPNGLFKSDSLIQEKADVAVLHYIPITIPAHLKREQREAATIGDRGTTTIFDPALRRVEEALFRAQNLAAVEVIVPPPRNPGPLSRLFDRFRNKTPDSNAL